MAKSKSAKPVTAEVPAAIVELVERFARNREAYRAGKYNETQVRREFIDPLFKALGWDIDNNAGYAEAYKDVVHEDAIRIGGAVKAPDYCFRIGGTRKFFLEAKKPSVDIKGDPTPAFQLRRYAWSGKLPLSILTDFEEFAVYDCRVKPDKGDKSSTARIAYYTFDQYTDPKVWSEISSVFARDAILKGSFDKYAQSTRRKKGTAEVDDAFLAEIESWRTDLARSIALRNKNISTRQLNAAVQLTVDRIIFLRICEDRGIEDYARLQALRNGDRVYQRLFELFEKADQRYNSGLFYFKAEKGRGQPDTLTPALTIDDKVLKGIIKGLYYPDSPYEFSVLSADILGHVYEQFLGKVIRLTKGHRAEIEEKPEVRKAGGVYYTPTYIVQYIVNHTVGKLLEGQSVKWVGTEKGRSVDEPRLSRTLRVLDPACGSGSFLIGAYQHLLDWYLKQYVENEPEKWAKRKKPPVAANQKGEYRLTTPERKRILLEHIYGVDIDAQAVEVTKLSLLLKVLEGETAHSLGTHLWYEKERALPDLSANIKCGNSLIGPDFYDNQQQTMFDEEERYRINAFDWKAEFAEVFAGGKDEGGFDAVIGNPPYIQQSMAEYFNKAVSDYCNSHFSSSMGRLNTFGIFIEQSLTRLVRNGGLLSFIVPNTLLTQEAYHGMRRQLLQWRVHALLTHEHSVFRGAVVETVVFVVAKSTAEIAEVLIAHHDQQSGQLDTHVIDQRVFEQTHKNAFLVRADARLLELKEQLSQDAIPLGSLVNINQAIALKHDRKASLFPTANGPNYKPVLDGRNIGRYSLNWDGQFLAYDINNIHSCKRTDIFETSSKVFFRRVGERLIATLDEKRFYALNTLVVITVRPKVSLSLKYLLGILNSRLLTFYYVSFLKSTKRVFSEIQARQLAELPIRNVDLTDKSDLQLHDQLDSQVQHMLNQNKRLTAIKTEHERKVIQRDIDATDRQIDRLVYDLYGLTDEEIAIVEEATGAT